jgi:hypothetical protein
VSEARRVWIREKLRRALMEYGDSPAHCGVCPAEEEGLGCCLDFEAGENSALLEALVDALEPA